MIKKITFVLFCLLSSNSFADTLLSCDGCTENQKRNLVFSQNFNNNTEYFYVIDFQNESLNRYVLVSDFEFGFIKEVFTATMPNHVRTSVRNYFDAASNYRQNRDDSILNNLITGFSNINSTQNTADRCADRESFYAFLSSSSVRTDYYNDYRVIYPTWSRVVGFWNDFVTGANVQVDAKVVQATAFAFDHDVTWEDGSSIVVQKRPDANTFDIVDGTALDCNGNAIPTSIEQLPDTFRFDNVSEFEAFQDYSLGSFGSFLTFPTPDFDNCRNLPIQTRCRLVEKGRYTCETFVPPCEQ